MRRAFLVTLSLSIALIGAPVAQHRLQPITTERGEPALRLALRKLDTVGNFMMTTAHPDDENNAMLAFYAHGNGFRTSLVSATRGEGGQNEIGPELFEALAVLRTEELLAAHRFDGAEQYFTRAVDFGYSFSVDETLEKWGKQEILGDYVRMIRTIRPDVMVGFVFEGAGGGQHHQASSQLSAEAFRAAADPKAFPEQIEQEGLRPWQAKKFYYTSGFGARGQDEAAKARVLPFTHGEAYDPLLGRTYAEVGAEARSMHKCQGMSQLLPLPASAQPEGGFGGPRGYTLHDTVLPDGVARIETHPFDGIDTSVKSLAAFAGAQAPERLATSLDRIQTSVNDARAAVDAGGSGAAVTALVRGLGAVRELRRALRSMGLTDAAIFEIDHRLALKEAQFQEALLLATDVRIDAIARDGLVVPGQSVQVDLLIANRSRAPVMIARRSVAGLETSGAICKDDVLLRAPEGRAACSFEGRIPADAKLTAAHFRIAEEAARFVLDPDVPPGVPFRPTPFTASFLLNVAGIDVTAVVPVQFRSEGNLFSGEKRAELHVVPKFAVRVSPEIAIVPPTAAASGAVSREVRVTVTNHAPGAAEGTVQLEVPQGWRTAPASAPVRFTRSDESSTVRFQVTPAAALGPGDERIRAKVVEGSSSYEQGYDVVEYPHTTRRHVLRAPEVVANVLDVAVAPNLTVGYVMGVGDQIPPAIEQLGARVELLAAEDLAWGDLSRFDVVMTGVRAYERRPDLRANNQRLIDYARTGGIVIVNYNKFEFNEAQYGPYPGRVGRDRVTAEDSAVRLLEPAHPVFTTPNRISEADWRGWRQERGLYFFDTADRDPRMVDLLELEDPFPFNAGPKRGALVEARVGTGRWIYVGLGLWRQLPAGTDGAYRLMANLISLGAR